MASVSHTIKSGCWADLDMLEIGNGNQTTDEYKTQFSMWCLLPAPLIMGHDVRKSSKATLEILLNKEAIAINQDLATIPAMRMQKTADYEVWTRTLSGGSKAAVLLRTANTPGRITLNWSDLGISNSESLKVRDLWAHTDRGIFKGYYTTDVPAHGAALLKITATNTNGINTSTLKKAQAGTIRKKSIDANGKMIPTPKSTSNAIQHPGGF